MTTRGRATRTRQTLAPDSADSSRLRGGAVCRVDGSIKAHRKCLQTALIEGFAIFKLLIFESQPGKTPAQSGKSDLGLKLCQRSTQTIVDALGKRQMMAAVGAREIQPIGIGKLGRVSVCGGQNKIDEL